MLWLGIALAATSPECEERVVKAPESSESWRCFYLWARRAGTWDAAHARLVQAVSDDGGNAHAMLNLGHIEVSTGQADAGRWYDRAVAVYERDNELEGQVNAHVAKALQLASRGAPADQVYGHLDAADAAAQESGEGLLQAIVNAQRARRMWRDGTDYAEAYRLIRSAETHAFPDGPYQLRLVVLHVMAGICQETGRLDEAVAASRRMVTLTAEAGDRYVEATARLNVANFALLNPDRAAPGTAERESALALEAAEEVGNLYILAGANCIRAEVVKAAGGDSVPLWLACRDCYLELGEAAMASSGALGAAAALVDTDPTQALELAAGAVHTSVDTGDVWSEVLSRFVHAVLVWDVEGDSAGIAAFASHEQASERLLSEQSDADTRAAVIANQVDGHHHLARRLARLGPGHLDGAIAATERLRARELRDALKAGGLFGRAPELEAELDRIGRAVTELNTRLGAEIDEASRIELEREREALVSEESALRDQLLASDVAFQAPTVAELQAELAVGEVVVAFQTPPLLTQFPDQQTHPWALIISAEAVGVVDLPGRRSLDALALAFGGLFEDEGASDVARARAGAAAFGQVLGPALASVGFDNSLPERLVVISDGPLHSLPFAALYTADAPLGTLVALSRGSSLTAWLSQRRSTARATGAPVVLGAPTWPTAGGAALEGLPAAAAEARAVARLLEVTALVGDDARESVLRIEGAPAPSLLHVAAHARAEGDSARRHALVLAEGGEHDGLLEAREARQLNLHGSVVVLSACRGAAGRVREGDGLDGLSRAFLMAGAPVVVGSLWPVRDDAAEAFFAAFIESLVDGESVDRALTNARRLRRDAGDPASAWAGMVAIGDGRKVLAKEARPGGCGASLGLVVLLGLGGALRRRQR